MSQQSPQMVKCGLCHYDFEYGVRVCQGCKGSVVYGATNDELKEARVYGAKVRGGFTFFVLFLLPMFTSSSLGWKVQAGWGLGLWGFVVVVGIAIWGAFSQEGKELNAKYGMVRTFRH